MPAVAGSFYPSNPEALRAMVKASLEAAKEENVASPVKALVAPHAGYEFCRGTMAAAFKQIEGSRFTYDTVVMIGPCHRMRTKAAALSSARVWMTPLGSVPVDTEAARELSNSSDRIEFNDSAHALEHSLEVQLPYLIVASGGKPFKILPILTSSDDPLDQETVAEALARIAVRPGTLIVASSDLSHYPNAANATVVDNAILKAVTTLDPAQVSGENRKLLGARYPGLACTMCGLDAVQCLERAANRLGISQAKLVSYSNSGMTSGDTNRVVGYGAVVFTGASTGASPALDPDPTISFSRESQQELVTMARAAVKAAVQGDWVAYDPSDNPELQARAGCFITLTNRGELRGCIGCFTTDEPLWKTVREMAVASATSDERFFRNRIKPAELRDIDIEISVLSRPKQISRPLEQIELGRDGIIIRDRGRSGTFLPNVAQETGWSLIEFLGHCAKDKAGLGWEGWKSPTARIYTYRTTIIEENDVQPAK
jgi:AmmeMemoRadiSam system protein B/AmmeMemoRadiSam system protein A